jgi:hypothetical protein
MRYTRYDIGEQLAGTEITVELKGKAANVILVDPLNLARYQAGQPFLYTGGHYTRSPVHIEVPEDGRWYVVVDLGGYRGRVRASVDVASTDAPPRELVVT